MVSGVAWSLFALTTAVPFCGPQTLLSCRVLLLAEVNAQRAAADLAPVLVHPTLDRIAHDRAREIAGGASVDPKVSQIRGTTRRIYREGYRPHDWTESVLVGRWGYGVFDQWREVQPRWYNDVRAGDYEHVGIGVGRQGDQPVVALLFGLTQRTVEWRRAAPLADLRWVRGVSLREVNRLRQERGRPSVAAHPILDSVAQSQAEDMLRRAYYDHNSPEGRSPSQRVRAAGYGRTRLVAENIAKGLFTPDEIVLRWMNSSGHRGNILASRAKRMGTGVAFGENANGFEVVWVQLFTSEPAAARGRERNDG